ncbi:UdgX family uracil-DNA binding protein [Rhodopirellula sp. MGV]|uniref:UdgX family uracil-DNA binding protein n=1 Tax=Rhodopirellula sp. MGV TaxID=2023130 RepID=UPI000B95F6AD|nr:UdgX family uracil-DNA binding protein [Rhodopirellula sp. MGV]OYP30327.1 uracil-DNA glycosylase [Rhodopirellula sp. MGV]PNY34683.1 uracil-DNA glycosylase [Rhodopirellula baltica]
MLQFQVTCFDDWRQSARDLLKSEIAPTEIHWIDQRSCTDTPPLGLFESTPPPSPAPIPSNETVNVPVAFIQLAQQVSYHCYPGRWELLYRVLWRLTHGEKHLLKIASDSDVIELSKLEKAVRRDSHKMKAFVRFRRVVDELGDHYIAWHRPDHYVLKPTAEFFRRRFDVMRWTIMTPTESCHWDGKALHFSEGMPRSAAPNDDELETLWKTYYANIFNPARIKTKAMKAEMPMKHWPTLPETELIDQMLREAPRRVEQMIRMTDQIASAQAYIPDAIDRQPLDLDTLRQASLHCEGCQLCQDATQTVFGHGPHDASVVFVGEQPGDQEDREGIPFVGPAGQLLRQAIHDVGFDLDQFYVTNAVKHFKFARSGKRRLHKTPSAREIAACRPWLDAELKLLRPKFLVCLGATASRAVFGPNFRLTEQRGLIQKTDQSAWTMSTYHPSAILRATDDKADQMRQHFEHDLALFAEHYRDTIRQ